MILTNKKIKEIIKKNYKRFTGKTFPYEIEVRKEVLTICAMVGADAVEVREDLTRISKLKFLTFNEIMFPEDQESIYSPSSLRTVIFHELAHIIRLEEQQFIFDPTVDSHDERFLEILKKLGVPNPSSTTEIKFK